jgi:hypothetical protein
MLAVLALAFDTTPRAAPVSNAKSVILPFNCPLKTNKVDFNVNGIESIFVF